MIPDLATADRSFMTLQVVLEQLTKHRIPASRRHLYHIFHSHPNAAVRDEIQARGLNFVGDQDEHPILGSLREAKAWLHADYNSSSQRASLPDAIRNGEITSTSVHIPRGYVCVSIEEQYAAFRELKSKDPLEEERSAECFQKSAFLSKARQGQAGHGDQREHADWRVWSQWNKKDVKGLTKVFLKKLKNFCRYM